MTVSWALRRLLGDTPSARDVAVYPLLALPVVVVLVAYGMLLGRVLVYGLGGLSLDIILTPWGQQQVGNDFVYQIGLRNHILGTLLLMALTCLFSILPGIGVAVYVTEYPGRLARLIGFATRMLRAMSVFIIGIALARFVGLAGGFEPESPISQLVRGLFRVPGQTSDQAGSGSYVAAALFLSLLVIPIIAKFAEEGLRSVPAEMREGSIAMGATLGYGMRRILLPWAAPNIVTGLLLGAAEAAGSLAIILFIAGNGEFGVGLTSPVTALDYALFATRYGTAPFIDTMGYRADVDYAYTSALLLLGITLGLTVVAMLLRRHFSRRYRGSLTLG
jgi:phosphate transport system permease protein